MIGVVDKSQDYFRLLLPHRGRLGDRPPHIEAGLGFPTDKRSMEEKEKKTAVDRPDRQPIAQTNRTSEGGCDKPTQEADYRNASQVKDRANLEIGDKHHDSIRFDSCGAAITRVIAVGQNDSRFSRPLLVAGRLPVVEGRCEQPAIDLAWMEARRDTSQLA